MNEDEGVEPEVTAETTDDLDQFEKEFFGKEEAVVEEAKEEEVEDQSEEDVEPLATEEDEDEPEAEEEEDEEEPQPKPKNRKSAKERINELTSKARETERDNNYLRSRIAEFEAKKEDKVEPKGLREQLPVDAPNPDAKGEDGEPIYELGEFDPKFIADLTRFTITEEMKAARENSNREAQAKAIQDAQQELANEWGKKLDAFETEVPDIREDVKDLTDTFQDLEPAYGEYLATTIMMSETGPQIMHYLSQNIGEAQRIVASGPAAATLALGRLEAMLQKSSTEPEKKRNIKKVSEAPEPPEERTRGHGGKFAVSGDTDDLDAFEREFFKKR